MRLTWTKINGAQGYIIYRAYGSGAYKAIKTITSGTTLNYTDTSATVNGGKYSYAVCGYRGSVKGAYTGKSYYCLTQNRISSKPTAQQEGQLWYGARMQKAPISGELQNRQHTKKQ